MIHRLVIALLAFGTLTGCEAARNILSGMDKPSASISGVKLQSLNLDGATLLFDVDVANPYSVPLPLVNLGYALASKGNKFLEGAANVQGTIPAKGSRTLQVPATVAFNNLMKTVSGITPGSVVPYTADLSLAVDAPGVGPLTLPLRKEGELPVPTVPSVDLKSIEWKSLDLNKAEAVLNLNVGNNNKFPLDLSKLAYDLSLGDKKVAAASVANSAKFRAGGSADLAIPISIKPIELGLGALQMLGGKGGGYKIAGSLTGNTPFGPLELPYEKAGQTVFNRK